MADLFTKPLANSYWVDPGRFLAGEHPARDSSSETSRRLRSLINAGIDTFIDLTEQHERLRYDTLLARLGDERLRHQRFPIVDHGIPGSPFTVISALDAIDAALAEGRRVYVHCHAGIGRTGTMVGCYLVRRGLSGDAALDRLNELWRTCERSQSWPSVPETSRQVDYVRRWQEGPAVMTSPRTVPITPLDRCRGALLGLAVGDALGSLLPPGPRTGHRVADLVSGGPLGLPRGAWTADTAMTLCLCDSLLARGGNDAQDQMQRYLRWQRSGEYSSTGAAIAVPAEVRRALASWQWNRKPIAGSHDPANLDPHPLARTLAVAMRLQQRPSVVSDAAAEACRPTLQSPVVLDLCRVFAAALVEALEGRSKQGLLAFNEGDAARALHGRTLKPQAAAILDGSWRRTDSSAVTADAVLAGALRAFEGTRSFHDGLVQAVNASEAPATAGAVFGGLAGAHYGEPGLPENWLRVLLGREQLQGIAQQLYERRMEVG